MESHSAEGSVAPIVLAAAGAPGTRPPEPADPEARVATGPPPPPAVVRDPWAWASALAVLPLLARSLGAPLGEPVAEDFDFLHRALFEPSKSLLDGGGSLSFWRPVSHQLYYELLGPLMLAHPAWIAALHAALLGLSGWLLYRVFRSAFSGPAAFAIASFPLLAESTRTLILWPSHFVDLGAFLFSVTALHEAARRRWWTALPSLLAALLCKELALVTAVLLPFAPGLAGGRPGARARLLIASGAVLVAWAAAYAWVRAHAALELPHGLERDPSLIRTPLAARLAWAWLNSLRAIVSLARQPAPADALVTAAAIGIAALSALAFARDAGARMRFRRVRGWVAWGLAWFALSAASLASIFPLWSPNRSQFASLGLGAAAVAVTSAAHPALAGALVAVRLGALALAPAPPAGITPEPEDRGAFIDVPRLVRLQRLMRETRRALARHHPTLPPGAVVGFRNLPLSTEYAFGGPHAIQAWYRDPTLEWLGVRELERDSSKRAVAIVEYQPPPWTPVVLVAPEALRSQEQGVALLQQGEYAGAIEALDRADRLQPDTAAAIFRGDNAGRRAGARLALGRPAEAEAEARAALRASALDVGARFVLVICLARRDRARALAHLDTLEAQRPGDAEVRRLRELLAPPAR